MRNTETALNGAGLSGVLPYNIFRSWNYEYIFGINVPEVNKEYLKKLLESTSTHNFWVRILTYFNTVEPLLVFKLLSTHYIPT